MADVIARWIMGTAPVLLGYLLARIGWRAVAAYAALLFAGLTAQFMGWIP